MAEEAKIHRDIHWGDKGKDVEALQHTLNDAVEKFDQLIHFDKLSCDGEAGKHTFALAHRVAYITGLPQDKLDEIAAIPRDGRKRVLTQRTQNLLRNPGERTDAQKKRAKERKEHDRKKYARQRANAVKVGLVTFDGKQVAAWIAHESLEPARKDGVEFSVLSGFRDPAYSTHLCIVMCGQSTCPGVCGGALSNHSCPPTHECVKYEGAVDVYPPGPLDAWNQKHNVPLIGNGRVLPADKNHFSHNGN